MNAKVYDYDYAANAGLRRYGPVFIFSLVFCVFFNGKAPGQERKTVESSRSVPALQSDSAAAVRIVSVKPTVFFVRVDGRLYQLGEVTLETTSKIAQASLEVKINGKEHTTSIDKVEEGKTQVEVQVADITQPAAAEFILRAGDKIIATYETTWEPQRQWEVCFVPITHHDLGYTDTINNVLLQYDGFYDDVLRFCEETDSWPEESKYRYTVEGSWSLQHFIENRPKEVVEKLYKYIGQGRIEIGALFGNEISALCSHEELIRLMYPSFRVARASGGTIRSGSITDVPGLSWGLPTVLANAGVKYFFAGLPTYFQWGRNDIHTFWDESAILRHGRPDAFHWEGPDGKSVLVYYQGSYGFFGRTTGPRTYKQVMDYLPGQLQAMEKQGSEFSVMRYIHNGVDNYPPQANISHIVREWNERWAYPRLFVATNGQFFEKLQAQCRNLRTFRGELPHTDYVVGAISTAQQTAINRLTHDKLHSAEKLAAIGLALGQRSYPAETIRNAYDNMLLYDEHTWGKAYPSGPDQDLGWHEKSHYAYQAAAQTESVFQGSLSRIADAIERKEKGRYLSVFNTLSTVRTGPVRVTKFRYDKPFEVIDEETGKSVPYQLVRLEDPLSCVPYAAYRYARGQFEPHELNDLVFIARDVPSLGYKSYRIVTRDKAPSFGPAIPPSATKIENRFFKLAISGVIKSLYDKELGRELIDPDAPHHLNQPVVRLVTSGKIQPAQPISTRSGQSGAVFSSLKLVSKAPGCSEILQEIILYHDIKRIDFCNRVLKDSTPMTEVYFAFPFQVNNPEFRFEGSNSVIKPLRDQFPGSNSNYYTVQHWANVSDGKIGLTLSALESHLMEFGGLWPCYVSQAHHGFTPPDFGQDFVKKTDLTKGHIYSFVIDSNFRTNFQPVQQGDMLFRYSLTSHRGDWKQGHCRNFGWGAANPLIPVIRDGARKGALPGTASFCQVDRPNVFVLTCKQAEDGKGLILRLIETQGKDTTATLTLPLVTINKAFLTNIVEDNQSELKFKSHQLKTDVKAFGITTIRLHL